LGLKFYKLKPNISSLYTDQASIDGEKHQMRAFFAELGVFSRSLLGHGTLEAGWEFLNEARIKILWRRKTIGTSPRYEDQIQLMCIEGYVDRGYRDL
jgi:hypothetical protein